MRQQIYLCLEKIRREMGSKNVPERTGAVSLLNQEYLQNFSAMEETRTQDLQKICQFLKQVCKEQHTVFVHGRGKRKSRNQKYLELFRRFLERQTIYDWHTASFQGRNNYCKTDPDATFIHMKDDHMRNAQLKPGYKVQIAVDSEYIVAADIFRDRNDVWTLVPFLKGMEKPGVPVSQYHSGLRI